MIVFEAQQDIRRAYVGGGPGIIFSALVWFAAAWAEQIHGTRFAFSILFLGGMFILPVGILLSRYAFRRAPEAKNNPLGQVALESTICMIGGLFAAWLFLPFREAYVFPLAAIAVGTHFAVFKTVYGDQLFWVLGAVLAAIGSSDILLRPVSIGVPFAVGGIEAVFGVILTIRALKK